MSVSDRRRGREEALVREVGMRERSWPRRKPSSIAIAAPEALLSC